MSKSKNKLRSFLHAVVVRVGCLSSPVEVNTEETNTTNAKMHIVDRREAMRLLVAKREEEYFVIMGKFEEEAKRYEAAGEEAQAALELSNTAMINTIPNDMVSIDNYATKILEAATAYERAQSIGKEARLMGEKEKKARKL